MPECLYHQYSSHMSHKCPHGTIVETSALDRLHFWCKSTHPAPLDHTCSNPHHTLAREAYHRLCLDSTHKILVLQILPKSDINAGYMKRICNLYIKVTFWSGKCQAYSRCHWRHVASVIMCTITDLKKCTWTHQFHNHLVAFLYTLYWIDFIICMHIKVKWITTIVITLVLMDFLMKTKPHKTKFKWNYIQQINSWPFWHLMIDFV